MEKRDFSSVCSFMLIYLRLETETNEQTNKYLPPVNSLHIACNSHGWARLKPRVRNFIWVSHVGRREPDT